jgi:hypothetical protein
MRWHLMRGVLVLGTPVAAAWLIGDQTTEATKRAAANGATLRHSIQPIGLGPATARVLGVLACVAVLGALVLLVWGSATGRDEPAWWFVTVPLMVGGVAAAYDWRLLTAGDIGANAGAILVSGVVRVVVAAAVLIAAVAAGVIVWERARA